MAEPPSRRVMPVAIAALVVGITTVEQTVLAVGTTLGVIAMTVALWPSLRSLGYRLHLRFDWRHEAVRHHVRLAAWVALYVAANQLEYVVIIVLNNRFTYRDRKLKGAAWIRGLISFYLVCSLGAVANVGIGSLVYEQYHGWWIAGIAGAIVGSVWNYVASGWLTWTRR